MLMYEYGGMGLHNAIADISNTAVLVAAANRRCHTLHITGAAMYGQSLIRLRTHSCLPATPALIF
jgi:hypothetical protein